MRAWIGNLIVVSVMVCVPPCSAQDFLHWGLDVPSPDMNFGPYADVVVEPDTGRIAACGVLYGDTYSEIDYVRFFGRDGWIGDWRGYLWGGSSGTDFGEDVSMAVTLAPAGLRTGFAYHNSTDASLVYIEYPDGLTEVISDSSLLNHGRSNSLRFSADGVPHIATRTTSSFGDDWLVHAYRIGSGGNCGVGSAAGSWQCDTVDIAEGIGEFISMDMDENGDPMIVYTSGTGVLKEAVHNGSGTGNCGYGDAEGMWDCTGLVTSSKAGGSTRSREYGASATLAVDPNSPATGKHVAFLSTETLNGDQSLDYATWVGSGGSCTDTRWDCMTLTPVGNGTVDLDIALDTNGRPLIVYRDSTDDEVRLAWTSGGGAGSGNCGPSNDWNCDIIDEGPPLAGTVGKSVAIASGPDGEPVVAYSTYDPLAQEWDLRIAHPWISRDFFETGDFSWWDSDVQ